MSLWDNIKNIITIPEEDDFDDPNEGVKEAEAPKKAPVEESFSSRRAESQPRVIKSKTVSYPTTDASQMQVVLVKPDRYDDVTAIADHINEKKTVVLNLEAADRELSRRIVDFLSGVTYANHGNFRKIANSTFIIVAKGTDVMGELMLEDFDEGKLYF